MSYSIGEEVRTQDNAITNVPLFAVQQRVRDYGYDPSYSDRIVWVHVAQDHEIAEGVEHTRLEAGYTETDEEPDGWTRTAFVDRWEFVTACLTRKGCEEFIRVNGHNLNAPRIYVYSAWRNAEWVRIRKHFGGDSHG